MQGKPPPDQAAQGPQKSTGGMPPRAPEPSAPDGGLRGIAPPAGASGKPKGRGGSGAQLRDVRWGMIFSLGWKLLGFFKLLVIGYALMTLTMNVVTMGTSQIIGEITNSLQSMTKANKAPSADQSNAQAAENTTRPAVTPAPPANTNAAPNAKTQKPLKERSGLAMVLLWSGAALLAMVIRLPMKALSTKLDGMLSN